jgi:hypothetical protein
LLSALIDFERSSMCRYTQSRLRPVRAGTPKQDISTVEAFRRSTALARMILPSARSSAEPFLTQNDDIGCRPCAELCRNGVGSTALRGEVLCRNCNPAALLKNRNELVIDSLKTDGSDHIELSERWCR